MDQFDPDSLYDDGARGLAGFDIDDVAPNAAEFDVDPVYRNLEVLPPTIAEIGGPTLGAESLWDEHSELLPFGAPTWTPAGALGAAGASPPAASSPFTGLIAPPVPPFVKLAHTHFAVAPRPSGAAVRARALEAVLEELTEAFGRRSVHWTVRERKCKLKCTAHAAHDLVDFDVRVYSSSGEAEHVVEFQLKSGCPYAFGQLHVEIAQALACSVNKPLAPLARAPPGGATTLRADDWAIALGCAVAESGARAPEATTTTDDDAAAIEQLNALAAMVDDAYADAAGARDAARALAAHAARDASRVARAPRAWAVALRVLSPDETSPTSGDAAVRLAALSLIAHLAVARCGNPPPDAPRVRLAGAEAEAFARAIEPLVHAVEGDACAPARVEAARALGALAHAFPTTLVARGAPRALEAACAQRDDLPLRLHAERALTRLVAAH